MLTKDELAYAKEFLGRDPTQTELNMLDVLWSEHCSYKSSKRWFHHFKTQGDTVYLGIGEGAGLVDIGDGYLAGVAMESHNHPSQIDPYNGAATGVGGIIRDVISQGCKAVGLMNCLRFGKPDKPRNAYLLEQVVKGISDYGNSVGIPMVGGELQFDDSYDGNCLVNVVCIGVIKPEYVVRSRASTPGHHLVLFGATTGRDGIAGVSFASEAFSDKEEENRSAVQIGDPLSKKVLIDALTELVKEKLIDGLQDFGGGGAASAAGELAKQGGTGVKVEVDKFPLREEDMHAHEIIVSESQERMLAVVDPSKIEKVLDILEEYDIPHGIVGEVTDDKFFTVTEHGEAMAKLPIDFLVGGYPEPERSVGSLPIRSPGLAWFKEPTDYRQTILNMLGSLNICDRKWVYQQYDQHVQSSTIVDIGENAGVLEFPLGKKLAFTSDCNSSWCILDPFHGTANSAAESLRNLVATGAHPIFIADCLNFGNPEHPESYAQFVESVKGLGQFSNDFKIPVIGGNVSLYNESETAGVIRRINPTPQIMIAGIIRDTMNPIRRNLITPWANIFLIGETHTEINGTEFQRLQINEVRGLPPRYRPIDEKKAMDAVLEAQSRGLVRSCNNIGRGGLAIGLMKMVVNSSYGFKLNLEDAPGTARGLAEKLFSESGARYIAEVAESNQPEFMSIMEGFGVKTSEIGLTVTDQVADFGSFAISVKDAKEAFQNGLLKYME